VTYMKKLSWNRTKIVATLGPATNSYKTIKRLIITGVDVVRLNLSHGTKQGHAEAIKIVRTISKSIGRPIAILADLPGPKLRIGGLKEPIELVKGKDIVISIKRTRDKQNEVLTKYYNLPNEIKKGDIIYLDDGSIKLRVKAKDRNSVICRILIGGRLKPEAGINVPGITLKTDFLTQNDRDLISFLVKQEVDLLALSFVRKPEDIQRVRAILKRKKSHISLIAKIEKHEALKNIDRIIDLSDGVMIARGDLGVEVPVEKVAIIQKTIIRKCNSLGKPVITATQMLESMIYNSRPTRAEVTDVANAIFDGTDALMLSGETAVGKYPVEAVRTMVRTARYVEDCLDYNQILYHRHADLSDTVNDVISFAACESALRLKARVIVTPTRSGTTARMISRYRPKAMIIAPTTCRRALMRLCLSWGVYPVLLPEKKTPAELTKDISGILKKTISLRSNEKFIVTGGNVAVKDSHTSFVKVETVSSK